MSVELEDLVQALTFKGLVASFVICAASPCFAQAHPDTLTMSCRAAASLVTSRGAIVLSSGPLIYDRYVSDAGHCVIGEELAKPAFVPTADNRQCFIGYFCFPLRQDGPR